MTTFGMSENTGQCPLTAPYVDVCPCRAGVRGNKREDCLHSTAPVARTIIMNNLDIVKTIYEFKLVDCTRTDKQQRKP